MTTFNTSTASPSNLDCVTLVLNSQLYQISNAVQAILSIILLLLFPIEVIGVVLPLVICVLLRKWRHPAKIFYYSIAISNLISFIFQDLTFGFPNLLSNILAFSTPFDDIFLNICFFIIKNYLGKYSIICAINNFLADIGPLFEYWTTLLFGLNKMLIVLNPLRSHLIKRIFNHWTLLICLLFLSLLYIPDFWIFYVYRGTCFGNIKIGGNLNIWSLYYVNLTYVKIIAPVIVISGSIVVICIKMTQARSQRKNLVKSNSNQLKSEVRSTIIMLIFGVSYVISTIPFSLVFIILIFVIPDLKNCKYLILYDVLQSLLNVFVYLPILCRTIDGLMMFIIPEFRKCVVDLLYCRFQINKGHYSK